MDRFTNRDVAKILRQVAAALSLKKTSIFQIRAYETAADAIEHSTAEVQDLWEEGKLGDVPGIGENLSQHLDELFRAGKVSHFDSITKGLPPIFFAVLDIPGVGPKTAQKIAEAGVKDLDDLKQKLKSGVLSKKGFSISLVSNLLAGLQDTSSGEQRMLLPFAGEQAAKILKYLGQCKAVRRAESLGSLRRRVATIGDLDFAVASTDPGAVIEHFSKMPGVSRVVNRGEDKATVMLTSHLHLDLLVGEPNSFGALLQHFTGSKHHNIHLRTLAEEKGYSLSEYGINQRKGLATSGRNKAIECQTEEQFYKILGMQTPVPEMREDAGEIELALKHKLPQVIEYGSLKGEVHLHSNFPIDSSHDYGANSLEEIVQKALAKGYQYVGLSDHSPSVSGHSEKDFIRLIENRTREIERLRKKYTHIEVLNGLEVDIQPDGALSLPDSVLKLLDYVIAGVHSSHRMNKKAMTQRIMKALTNPYVKILAHPTGRLLDKRPSFEAEWDQIFDFCAQNKKVMEINAYPNRLDLRDDLVRAAVKRGVMLIINTDAHEVSQMDYIEYGVSVARRGWAEAKDVLNTKDVNSFLVWFNN